MITLPLAMGKTRLARRGMGRQMAKNERRRARPAARRRSQAGELPQAQTANTPPITA